MIDWDEDLQSTANERMKYFNLTQPLIMEGVMTHWTMLEKMKSSGDGGDSIAEHTVTAEWDAPFLKAIEWNDAYIAASDYGVVQWPALEYLVFTATYHMGQLVVDLTASPTLKCLALKKNAINDLTDDICTLRKLSVLSIYIELIKSVAHCIEEMTK